ncbi:TlpA disulfide reductase family protein [Pedobacter frigoris]|uniref:TlpA family protein disulfide reductase n=1 Tax=Pedobacter frigoris TaxID=2571272 RepID=UPI00292FD449|nr:TlpA disulfide reductase family protein [Pedobacter frigoris]
MKKYLLVFILFATGLNGFGQKVRLSGRLLNLGPQTFELSAHTGYFKDSLVVNADGTFNYETDQIKSPFQGILTNRKNISFVLFIAPGYDMQINADAKDPRTLSLTTNFSGIGAKANAYWGARRKLLIADTVNWNAKDADTYIHHLLEEHKMLSGLIEKHFNSSNTEPYSDHFKRSLLTDLKYDSLNELFDSYASENNLNWQQIKAMVSRIGITSLEKELNEESNLAGLSFSFLVTGYPDYCYSYNAFPADEEIKKKGNYQLYLTSKFYTGKVYDFVMYKNMPSTIAGTFKLEDFEKMRSYVDRVGDSRIKALLKSLISTRIKEASELKPGTLSPLFNLPDTSGKMHELAEFRGKVVYLDLWASWCGPCKEETPHLKKIYDHYKGNNKVEIISIATSDAKNRTKRYDIISKDQMTWLQLEDTDDSFAKSYQVRTIPRFIIIDKQGRIVDSNAPRPSDPAKLMAILEKEIQK